MTRSAPTTHRSVPRRSLALATLLLLTACGGGGGGTPTTSLQLLLDQSSVSVVRGLSQDVAVELRINAGSLEGTVDLVISDLPEDVSATFIPSSLSAAQREAVLRLQVGAGASEGSSDLVVSISGQGTAQATLDLVVQSLTVQGRVVGLLGFAPGGDLEVSSQGKAGSVDALTGAFTLEGLSSPYDLDLWRGGADPFLHRFEGLSSDAPTIQPGDVGGGPDSGQQAEISGQVLGGDPVPAGRWITVCVAGLDAVVFGCDRVGAGGVNFDLQASWATGQPEPARLVALYAELDLSGRPMLYRGYATLDLTLNDLVNVGNAHLPAFQPIGSTILSASFDVEGAADATEATVNARFLPNLSMQIHAGPLDTPNELAWLVPSMPGMGYSVSTIVANRIAWGVSDGPELGSILVPSIPTLLAPNDLAPGVTGDTVFSANHQGRMRTYLWQPNGGGGVSVYLTTAREAVTLPDVTAHDLAFPSGADYEWLALGHGTDDAERAAAQNIPTVVLLIVSAGFGGHWLQDDGALTIGVERAFQFAP